MKQLCSQPLISGKCVDGVTEYRVFATDGRIGHVICGSVAIDGKWFHRKWQEDGTCETATKKWHGEDIPVADLNALLSGVIESKESL